jgi:predicted deacylase
MLAGTEVPAGRRRRVDIPAGRLVTGTGMAIAAVVVHGRRPGPTVWLSGAIHGDEVNGVRIVERVVAALDPKTMAGTAIAVPIVNVFGFVNESRYLPDRRDLNRLFPGSRRGSLGSRLADLFMSEVVSRADYGIDFHTATNHRVNPPQIRADLDDGETLRLARAFGAPLTLHARLRDGSLREAAGSLGKPVLVFEGGEAHRFDEHIISTAATGTLRVLATTGMIETAPEPTSTVELRSAQWVRARRAGMFHAAVEPGESVGEGTILGYVAEALASRRAVVRAPQAGHVVGLALNPLVNRGDALVNIGSP